MPDTFWMAHKFKKLLHSGRLAQASFHLNLNVFTGTLRTCETVHVKNKTKDGLGRFPSQGIQYYS